jgi:hypothetical protein
MCHTASVIFLEGKWVSSIHLTQRDLNHNGRAPFRSARDLHGPMQLFDSLPHAGQAEMMRAGNHFRHEPLSIVLDEQLDRIG